MWILIDPKKALADPVVLLLVYPSIFSIEGSQPKLIFEHLTRYIMSTKFYVNLHPRSSHQNILGYTLLEILAVLGIVGILVAIAAPSLLAMQGGANINNSLEKVRSTLELSQIEAIKKKKTCTVAVKNNTQMTSDCLIGFSAFASDGTPVVQLDSGITMQTNNWSTTANQVIYSNKGLTQSSGTIVLASRDTYIKKCLTIKAGIGLIRAGTYINNICEISE